MELNEIISKAGLNPIDVLSNVGKIADILPKIKEFLPMVKDWEKTLSIKENQKIIYSLMPTGKEVFIYVFVIEQRGNETLIVDTKFKFLGFEELEKVMNFIPKM